MNNWFNIFSTVFLGTTIVSGALVIKVPSSFAAETPNAEEEDFDTILARVEAQYKSNQQLQAETAASIEQVETEYKAEIAEAEKDRKPTMEEKMAAAKAKGKSVDDMLKSEDTEGVEATEEVDLFASPEEKEITSTPEETAIPVAKQVAKQKTTADYLKERNPQYSAPATPAAKPAAKPAGTPPTKGRRPFIRSELDTSGKKVYFAGSQYSEMYGFADADLSSASSSSYSGYNEADKYIFPNDFAIFCQIDAKMIMTSGVMAECLKKILAFKNRTGQSAQDEGVELYEGGVKENTMNAVSTAAQAKNVAANYEKEVLIPMQEQSSQSTTERGDFQTLTMTSLEGTKTTNRLVDIYATMVAMQSLKDFGTFSIKSQELTQIKEDLADSEKNKEKAGDTPPSVDTPPKDHLG